MISAVAMRKLELDAPGHIERFRLYRVQKAPHGGRVAAMMDTEALLEGRESISVVALARKGANFKAWSD
jgi:hypothetical protein